MRPLCSSRYSPEYATADGRPEKPAGKHPAKRHFVPVENNQQFSHQDDLRDYSREADEDENSQKDSPMSRTADAVDWRVVDSFHRNRINLRQSASQTKCFLVGPAYLMTNHH